MGKLSKLFGFHTKKTQFLNQPCEGYEEFHKYAQNGLNIAGWIPGISNISGTMRVIDSTVMLVEDDNSGQHSEYYVGSYLRSLVEIIGLGFFFIPADVIIYIKRRKKMKKLAKQQCCEKEKGPIKNY